MKSEQYQVPSLNSQSRWFCTGDLFIVDVGSLFIIYIILSNYIYIFTCVLLFVDSCIYFYLLNFYVYIYMHTYCILFCGTNTWTIEQVSICLGATPKILHYDQSEECHHGKCVISHSRPCSSLYYTIVDHVAAHVTYPHSYGHLSVISTKKTPFIECIIPFITSYTW